MKPRVTSLLLALALMLTGSLSLAAQPRIVLDFRQARLADVVRVMATEFGRNIVITEKAGDARINVFLQQITVEEALDAIARISGMSYRVDAKTGVVRVMTLEEYQRDIVSYQREQTRVLTLRNSNVVAAANAIGALFGKRVKLTAPAADESGGAGGGTSGGTGGTATTDAQGAAANSGAAQGAGAAGGSAGATSASTMPLTASHVAEAVSLSGSTQARAAAEQHLAQTQVAPPPLHVTYNRLHNLLILRSADTEALADAEKLVQELDKPTRQVLLEMQVLEVTLDDGFRSAVDIGLVGGGVQAGPPVGHADNPLEPTSLGRKAILGLGNFPLESGTAVFQLMNERLQARLQLAATENRVRVLATPLLLASNNQKAKLFIGEERILTTGVTATTTTNNNQTVTAFGVQTEKRNIGNTLNLLPRINADRTVTLVIQHDSSQLLPKAATIPVGSGASLQAFPIDSVSTANLDVTVVARDGFSVAVGGMIRERKGRGETKVPVLGDLPVLGALFKRQEDTTQKSQLLLVIRPHILDTPEESERARARVETLSGESLTAPRRPTAPDAERLRELSQQALAKLAQPAEHPELQAQGLPQSRPGWWPKVEVLPVAAWQHEGVHLTVLELHNRDSQPLTIAPERLPGAWLAINAERHRLGAAGAADDHLRLILLSERPFDSAVTSGEQP